ncbi:hypothetical protein [Oceanobacillus sp. FSL H7-0719]|uniref:hypothetical protein n=1 Tax=Oceanobacillus sp. FSL H7-0719 TaxID=2954507 RepID=UPI00324E80DD
MEITRNPLNDIALQLFYLGIMIVVFMVAAAIIIRFLPILRRAQNFILSLAGLAAFYVWVQITFM